MSEKDKTRVAGYIRVSQERQVRNGYGLEAQETDIRRFAEYKDWRPVELYREEGVSGYKRDRPSLERLLADAKAGKIDVVVFPSIDRTGRSVKDIIEIDTALRDAGASIVFLREGIDTSTPTGQLFRNIMASVAEFEGRIIYERLSKGKRRKRANGGYIGGWLPYGYWRDEDGTVKIAPKEAKVVKRIFEWAGRGKSLRWIAVRLNDKGQPPRKGGSWRVSTIQGILRNPFYTGYTRFDGDLIPGKHEPIVSVTTFQNLNHKES
jgi:site-specific DNA recombinase